MQILIFNIYNEYCFDKVDEDDIYEQYYVQSLYYKKDVIDNEFLSEMETAILLANETISIHLLKHQGTRIM